MAGTDYRSLSSGAGAKTLRVRRAAHRELPRRCPVNAKAFEMSLFLIHTDSAHSVTAQTVTLVTACHAQPKPLS
jgi:hypothetical protein